MATFITMERRRGRIILQATHAKQRVYVISVFKPLKFVFKNPE